ncbi:DUF4190 domain-containing protein [Archangium lansingense]|uniref:DUF4190 domain-containing protein n=1 Tax=Archangium lansingense TaxID=2995310 RepID=UPI003B82016A
MESPSLAPPPAADEARCQSHPDQAVLGTCTRCGTFFCALDRETVNDKDYCTTCATRPEVDYLEAFRLKHWGKRDSWTWFVGFSALAYLAAGARLLMREDLRDSGLMVGLISLAGGTVGVCFWLGLPFARLALCFVPIVAMVVSAFSIGPGAISSGIWPIIVTLSIYQNTRNKLFFKEEVSREALEKAWNLYANNAVARTGFLLGLVGLLAFPLAPVALLCSIIGLRRVDPTATPPIGRKGQAIAGIVLGAVSTLGWTAFWVVTRLNQFGQAH